MPHCCTIHPDSSILGLYCYSWSTRKMGNICIYIYIYIYIYIIAWDCVLIRTMWLLSSMSNNISGLLNVGGRPLTVQLNSIVVELSSVGPNGIHHICNKPISMSALDFEYFFIAHYVSFMHTSTCPFFLWLYDDDIIWWMSRSLQKYWNFSETNFMPTSVATLLGSQCSAK